MANSLIMSYVLKKMQNTKSPVNNRWFAYVNSNGILSTRGLANHMVEHGMTSKSDVLAMLAKLSECIPELQDVVLHNLVVAMGVYADVRVAGETELHDAAEDAVSIGVAGHAMDDMISATSDGRASLIILLIRI